MTCEIHPFCQNQGCTADPTKCCQLVIDRQAKFKDLDDTARWRRLQYHLRSEPGVPVPAEWVEWLLVYVKPPKAGLGVLVPTPEKPNPWKKS